MTRKIALLTREYPPEVYGGAGTHVEYLVRELRRLLAVTVHCWGAPREEPDVESYMAWDELNVGGHLAKLTWSIPHVMTIHSLEPLRPWKAEQLGGGYALSLFCERTAIEAADAVIAVSHGVRRDVLETYPSVDPGRVHVIHNGIDPEVYRRQPSAETLERYGIDATRPYAFFNGRITRQKGLPLLLAAAAKLDRHHQLVVVASSPDTPAIAAEVNRLADQVRAEGRDLVWIDHFIPREHLIHLHSSATVFVCPSVYEPFGLVILEAMACETAVVASRVGGIPEIVVEGETGFLVDLDADYPEKFSSELAARIRLLLDDAALAGKMGEAGRRRVVQSFGWPAIATTTAGLYESLLER